MQILGPFAPSVLATSPVAHVVVGLLDPLEVVVVDANGNAHDHVLRALHDLVVDPEEVAALEGLVPEVAVGVVALVVDGLVKPFLVGHDDVVDALRD